MSCTALAPRIVDVARFALRRALASLDGMADTPWLLRTCAASLGWRRSLDAAKMVHALNITTSPSWRGLGPGWTGPRRHASCRSDLDRVGEEVAHVVDEFVFDRVAGGEPRGN